MPGVKPETPPGLAFREKNRVFAISNLCWVTEKRKNSVLKLKNVTSPPPIGQPNHKNNRSEKKEVVGKRIFLSIDVFADFSWVGMASDCGVRRFHYYQ